MFRQTWKKYLPVITILLKRSAGTDQLFNMNHTDFERAAGGRKIKFSFTHFELNNGKLNNPAKQTPLAKDLAVILQEDVLINKMLINQQFEFSMNNEFQLLIKNTTVVAEAENESELEEEVITEAASNSAN
jgi:hypothetical protein